MRAKPVTAFSIRKQARKERSVVVMAADRADAPPEEGFVASTDGPASGDFALPSVKTVALAVTGATAAFIAQPMHILQMAFAGNGGNGAQGGDGVGEAETDIGGPKIRVPVGAALAVEIGAV